MPSKCILEFDRENPIYFNGETIHTRVTLTTTTEKNCREVYLEFQGEAKVQWTVRKNKSSTTYRGEVNYVSNHTTLHGEGRLPPGTYTYNLDITLPVEAPSTCSAEYGDVKYEISLTINRPFHFDNVFRSAITVVRNVDLNFYPELLIPLQAEDIKYLCCWLCKAGPIISTLTIPYGGYATGQNIKYTLHVDNQSNGYDVKGICLRLIQTCIYKATQPKLKVREESAQMAEVKQDEPVLRLSKRVLDGILYIPPIAPSTDTPGLTTIITVNYHIEMSIKTGKCHKDSKIVIPIRIGTIPLYQTVVNSDQIPNPQLQPTAPMPNTFSKIGPHYGQSTLGTSHFAEADIDEHHRSDGFLQQTTEQSGSKVF